MSRTAAKSKRPIGKDRIAFNVVSYILLGVLTAVCLLPFLLVNMVVQLSGCPTAI